MYFRRISRLKQRLATESPSARAVLPYFISNTTLILVASGLPDLGYEEADLWELQIEFLNVILQAAIAAAGIWWCYRSNGGTHGRDFLARVNSLGFVLAVRFLVFLIALISVMVWIPMAERLLSSSWELWYLLGLGISSWFWLRLAMHLRQVTSGESLGAALGAR